MTLSPLKQFLVRHLRHDQLVALHEMRVAVTSFLGRRESVALPGAAPVTGGKPGRQARAAAGAKSACANYGLGSEEAALGLLWPWNYVVSHRPRRLPSGRRWPKISVVTVTYNQGQFLEETIRSVVLQGYPNLEYIVVDGASTDNTRKLLDRYRNEISVVISEPDNGQSDALNKGFRHATGDILAWLNSDDQYLPDTLARVAEAFDAQETDMVVGGTLIIKNFERLPAASHHCSLPVDRVVPLPLKRLADFEGEWQKGSFFYQPEVFWTRELWNRAGARVGQEFRYAMDYELWLRFAAHGARVLHIPDPVTLFRVHDAQKTKWREGEDYPEHVAVGRHYLGMDTRQAESAASIGGTDAVPKIASTIPKSIFDRHPVTLHHTPAGTIYIPADAIQDEAAMAIRRGIVYRDDMAGLAQRYVRPGTVVIDVGAGFGQGTLLLAKAAGPTGQVLAFEADPYVFDVLQKTLQGNQCQNVRVFSGVVFDGSRRKVVFPRLDYSRFPSYSTHRVDLQSADAPNVECLTIDELAIQAPVSLMQVSAQGSELAALLGAEQTIRRNRMPILVDFDEDLHAELGYSREQFERFVASVGYRVAETFHTYGHLLLPEDDDGSAAARESAVGGAGATAHPQIALTDAPFRASLCKLLRSRADVDECTRFLKRNGFVSHNLICKDWDIAHIVPEIGDGNFLDMGSSDSYILKNVCLKRTRGDKYGIDLQQPDVPLADVKYIVGDLMDTRLPSGLFRYISCLSVIEHQVDYDRFAREVSRLLEPGGKLFLTFDYWEPLLVPPVKLYGLDWQPLDRARVERLVASLAATGLDIVQDFDFRQGEPVIRWGYYSPHPDMRYTFALATFRKR
jgi:FkbM family methyltransferase